MAAMINIYTNVYVLLGGKCWRIKVGSMLKDYKRLKASPQNDQNQKRIKVVAKLVINVY